MNTLMCELTLKEIKPGISIKPLAIGVGRVAHLGDTVQIQFSATLLGQDYPFMASMPDKPLKIVLGKSQVIPGLEMGVIGMAVNGSRLIKVPPHLAYGQKGFMNLIPPDATIVYRVTMLKITPKKKPTTDALKY